MPVAPKDFQHRSFLYRPLAEAGAVFETLNGSAAAMRFAGEPSEERARAEALGLADLSALRRIGFKGWNIDPWLTANGATVEAEPNRTYPQADGTRIARLAASEVVVLGTLAGEGGLVETLGNAWSMEEADGCFFVPRAEVSCWLRITGRHAAEMFAKICAVDLRPDHFPPHAIAQTNVARLNAIVVRDDAGPTLAYDILTDIASAHYLWLQLIDAAAEYGGGPIGLETVRNVGG